MDFYMYLPSNTGDYPNNSIGRFRVKLPNQIDLDGDWEVALVEIAYPVTWFTVSSEEEAEMSISFADPTAYKVRSIPFNNYTSIDGLCDAINYTLDNMKGENGERANFYFKYDNIKHRVGLKAVSRESPSNIEFIRLSTHLQYMLGFKSKYLDLTFGRIEVVFEGDGQVVGDTVRVSLLDLSSDDRSVQTFNRLSTVISKLSHRGRTPNCKLTYSAMRDEVILAPLTDEKPNIKFVRFSESVQYRLGLSEEIIYPHHRNKLKQTEPAPAYYIVAEDAPDLRAGQYALFVYCDVVHPQILGNTLAPILRAVSIRGNYGEIVDQLYNNPHYVPVLKREFGSIEINISDDRGRPVNFQYGKLFVKLHFRIKQ